MTDIARHRDDLRADLSELFARIGRFLLLLMAVALPWDLFQRIPFSTITVAKGAGVLLIITGFARCVLGRKLPRTGLEGPIALFALAFPIATVLSIDPATSSRILVLYVAHLLLFCSTATLIRNGRDARILLTAYILSAAGVALLTFLCKAGVMLPTDWQPRIFPYSGRLIEQAQNGVEMRMTGASPDLNQGALLLLMAFMMSWQGLAKAKGAGRLALVLVQTSLLGALFISQSRSALVCAVALVLYSTARYCMQKNKMALVSFVLVSAVAAVAISGPVRQWMTREDSSTSSRAITYRAALQEVPSHLIIGTGLGTSDEALARTEHGRGANGRTIHSVPLKLLLETGVLGLAAYVWFWVLLALRTRRVMLRSPQADDQRLGKALLWMGVAIIAMQLVQPFTTMPHFPILLGIWAGAVMTTQEAPSTDRKHTRWSPAFVAAAVVPLGALVVFNIWIYQTGSKRVVEFADTLAEGPELEKVGRWDDARDVYKNALAIASSPVASPGYPRFLNRLPMSQVPFYDVLATVIDIPQIENQMNVLSDRPDPEAVCHYGIGRIALALGDTDTATNQLGVGLRDRHFADLRFILAESLWRLGEYRGALLNYRLTALYAKEWRNLRFRFRMAELDERIAELDNASSLNEWLERAYLLRQRGRWPEAIAIYEEVYKGAPDTPETAFALGVHEFLRGEYAAARKYWEPIAANHADEFPEAAKALANLSEHESNREND